MREKVLVLFSGGLDSMLATCKIIEEGYKVMLVHYNNGCSSGVERAEKTAQRLIERYGENQVEFLGIGTTMAYFKILRETILQKTSGEIAKVYPHFCLRQFDCLTCRSAMYVYSILLCKKFGIYKICEGARKSQLFSIEEERMLHKYSELLKEYDITLFTPVLELKDDYEREIELLMRGIEPIVYESQCYLGTPMLTPFTEEEGEDLVSLYENELKPKCYQLIKRSDKMDLNLKGKLF